MCCTKTSLWTMVALTSLLLPRVCSGAEAVRGGDPTGKVNEAKTTLNATATTLAKVEAVPGGDPLDKVKEAKKTIEANERALAKTEQGLLDEITAGTKEADAALARMKDLKDTQDTLNAFRELSALLRKSASGLMEQHAKFKADNQRLIGSMTDAAPAFRKVGEMFQQYAKDEKYEDLKADYGATGQSWITLAEMVTKGAANYEPQTKEIDQAIEYVQHTAVFLERFERHLDSFPDLSAIAERNRHLESLKRYIQGFEQFRTLLHKFNSDMRSQSIASDLRPTSQLQAAIPATASAKPDTRTTAKWFDAYK